MASPECKSVPWGPTPSMKLRWTSVVSSRMRSLKVSMLRLTKLACLTALLCLPASAQRIFGWCEQGGQRAITNGNQSQNEVQGSYPACTITVFNGGTVVPATIFSDAGLTTPLANPFTATSTGFWAFYAAPSTYDVGFSGTGITTPFTIAGYTNSGGGGGGGGTVGPGTVNNLARFTSSTNVGNATCTDDGVTPLACGLGVSLSTSALFTVKPNNASTGITANLLVARDGSATQKVQNAQPTDTNNVIGVAGFGAGTTGSVSIAYSGQFPCTFDNQTAIGDWVTLGTNSRCHDAGATEPAGVENMGNVNSINAGAGTLAGVDWGLPNATNTSAGGGTGIVGNCSNAGALSYYPSTGITVGCPAGATVDGAGNITAPSITTAGSNAGFIVSQQGSAPALSVANSNYLYGDSTIATTFGTVLPSAPGTLNQVMAITSVPDATHIKLGYISTPGVSSGTPGNPAIYTGATSLGSSNQTLDASAFAGTAWTDKVVAAYTALGGPGGTVIVPDSIADDGAATAPIIPSNVTLRFTGSATFTFCNILLGKFSKIYNADALLLMKVGGSGCTGLTHSTQATLQDNDKTVLDHVRVDCANQPSSQGITFTGGSAQDSFKGVSVQKCGTAAGGAGLFLADQFGTFTDLTLQQNYVNLKMYTTNAQPGVSSNTFTNLKTESPGSGVNVILQNSNTGGQTQADNLFINHQCQNGTVACIAMFGGTSGFMSAKWIGAAPELNGGGAASIVIDGLTIKQAGAWYLNNSHATLDHIEFSDATANPDMLLESGSFVNIVNSGGGGPQFNKLITADSTSFVNLGGDISVTGIMQNVASYPSTISSGRGAMVGSPVSYLNSAVPNVFTGNALTPPFSSTTGTSSNAIANDATYGQVNTVTYAASAGSTSTNLFTVANAIPSQGVTSDYYISFLLMSSVDTILECYGHYSGGDLGIKFTSVPLYASRWSQIKMWTYNIASAHPVDLSCFPDDSAGATVSITRLESLAYPSGATTGFTGQASAWARSQVIQSGAVNPNNGNCSAVGTSASPSVASCANASQGNFSCATAATGATCQVNTTRVTSLSQIYVQEDETQGTKLGVTCNTGTTVIPTSRLLASKVANTSFTINLGTVTTNPACFSYRIDN